MVVEGVPSGGGVAVTDCELERLKDTVGVGGSDAVWLPDALSDKEADVDAL